MPTSIKPGALARHPAHREPGTVRTIAYDYWTKEPSTAWVEFGGRAYPVRASDLTAVEAPQPVALRVVEPVVVA